MASPHAPSHPPLEADWVHRSFILTVEGRTVTGTARANWGDVEVSLTSPIAGVSRELSRRGWSFAVACLHRPEYRYALRGQFTPKGVQAAEQLLADLFLDWLALSRREAVVAEACHRARLELASLAQAIAARRQPHLETRAALRLRFRAGAFTQQEYQRHMKEVRRSLDEIDGERWQAVDLIHHRFAAWVQTHCGRKVSFDEAEKLLTEVGLVVDARR